MLQHWKYAIIMVFHNKKDRTKCDNYRSISLVEYAGKILLKIYCLPPQRALRARGDLARGIG